MLLEDIEQEILQKTNDRGPDIFLALLSKLDSLFEKAGKDLGLSDLRLEYFLILKKYVYWKKVYNKWIRSNSYDIFDSKRDYWSMYRKYRIEKLQLRKELEKQNIPYKDIHLMF
jgi:hypothetical protein